MFALLKSPCCLLGWWLPIGPNFGSVSTESGERVRNTGVEASVVKRFLSDDEWYSPVNWSGVFFEWSVVNGFGGGVELGSEFIGIDVGVTELSGMRGRIFLTTGFATAYIGADKHGPQFGALLKLPLPL